MKELLLCYFRLGSVYIDVGILLQFAKVLLLTDIKSSGEIGKW